MLYESPVVYPPGPGYPFYITAKRYRPSLPGPDVPGALTLVVLHSTSFHKETWEPSLAQLFSLASRPGTPLNIREAWAIDCPNHGHAGRLNERTLEQPQYANYFTCARYAEAVHRFLSAGPNYGARIDFASRNLVGMGHSLGANAIILLQCFLYPPIPFSSLVIVEPMLSVKGSSHLASLRGKLVTAAEKRWQTWTTREEAFNFINARPAQKKWDPRVVELFVRHAISPRSGCVALACTREQEVTMYKDEKGPIEPVEVLNRICLRIPVHLILGEIPDFIPSHVHEALKDPGSGRRFASVKTILGVGHLIPQEVPDKLGDEIYRALANGQPGPRL